MNEREQFEKYSRSIFERTVARIQTMSADQVVEGLRAIQAARNMMDGTLAFLHSVSLAPTADLEDEIGKLRSDVNSYPHPTFSPTLVSDYIEDALKKRLETLRRRAK
jgi:hypothetical protein